VIISGERNISYPEIHARAARAATGFRSLGVSDGKPVADDAAQTTLPSSKSQALRPHSQSVVPINWHLKAEEVAYILADSGAEILVCRWRIYCHRSEIACPAISGCWW